MGFPQWENKVLIRLLFIALGFHYNLPAPISSSFLTSPNLCHPNENQALLQFKDSFTITSSASTIFCGGSYPKTESWKEGVDCCSWDGVTCDNFTGHVTGLHLVCSWLLGPIHSNSSLFLLQHLQSLELAFNNFNSSPISSSFGQFTSLTHLDLSYSSFSGLVPPEISHLTKLVSLNLSNNNLHLGNQELKGLLQNLTELGYLTLDELDMSSVSLDSFHNMSHSMKSLRLRDCQLEGNLPENVLHLPNLQNLNLMDNSLLHGSLPIFNWNSPLRILSLSNTGFSGNIHSSIGKLKSLDTLDLRNCKFEGSIPASIGNLTEIRYLLLSSNNFTGPIPSSLSNLESLVYLMLDRNNFSGSLPDVFHNFINLDTLDISNNSLSGQMPLSLFNLNQVSRLSLYSNKLSGPLPPQINGLATLIELDLSDNSLNGTIPPLLFVLPSLRYLRLKGNQFTGEIPEFLSTSLEEINLAKNSLTGTLQLDMFAKSEHLEWLDLSDNKLSLEVNNTGNSSWPMLTHFYLSSCNITSFPLFLMTQFRLQYLSLSRNKIHGDFPEWLWLLGNNSLGYLDLSHNFLTSMADPSSLLLVQVPYYFDLSFNSIEDHLFPLFNLTLPEHYFPIYTYFFASNNKLAGEIPHSICNSIALEIIDLSNNSLSGRIPECLGTLDHLSVLNLRMNNFSGPIPRNFTEGSQLLNLNLNGNHLEAPIPQSLRNCKRLEVFDVGNNQIGGEFPHWLELLPKLQVLVLRSNKFHGLIREPVSLAPFPTLRILDVSNNVFADPLPSKYFEHLKAAMNIETRGAEMKYMGQHYMAQQFYYQDSVVITIKGHDIMVDRILTVLATLDFSSNRFEGQIPVVLGNLNSLEGLNLSFNALSGNIPSSMANMTSLESLDLASNKLVGTIPQQLKSLNYLAFLNLSYNLLEGPIPQGNQWNTFSNESYIGNSRLCGFPLSKTCGPSLEVPLPSASISEHEASSWLEFDWKIVMMGYASGLVIGFSIGYMILKQQEPLWFMKMVEMIRKQLKRNVRRRNRMHRQ